MARGSRIFWLVLLALLGPAAWFGTEVVRMKAARIGAGGDARTGEEARR